MQHLRHDELAHFSELIDHIYQGVMDAEVWHSIPTKIAQWMHASSCTIFTPFHAAHLGGFRVAHNISSQTMELWESKYFERDLWIQRAISKGLAHAGTVLRDQDLATDEEFLATTVAQEFYLPAGIGRVMSGIVFSAVDSNNMPVLCTCNRPFDTPFTEDECKRLQLLTPHLSRALGTMLKLRDAEFKASASRVALDRLVGGVLLFCVEGKVVYANTAARTILNQQDGLRLKIRPGRSNEGELLTSNGSQQIALDNAIREAVSPDILTTQHFSKSLIIYRPSGFPPYALNFSSLPAVNEFGLGADIPRAIAFLSDTSSPITIDDNLLRDTYGLTPAEIRVAALVAEGATLAEIAKRGKVSENTVKTQLKHVYDKTSTNNRAKLVKMLLALSSG